MAENRRGKDNRYYLSRGQMIILGGTFTLASVVIFSHRHDGRQRTSRSERFLKKDEPLVRMPVKPAGAAAGTAAKNDEITFYDTLAKSRSAAGAGRATRQGRKPAEKIGRAEVKETKAAAKSDTAVGHKIDGEESRQTPNRRRRQPRHGSADAGER